MRAHARAAREKETAAARAAARKLEREGARETALEGQRRGRKQVWWPVLLCPRFIVWVVLTNATTAPILSVEAERCERTGTQVDVESAVAELRRALAGSRGRSGTVGRLPT